MVLWHYSKSQTEEKVKKLIQTHMRQSWMKKAAPQIRVKNELFS